MVDPAAPEPAATEVALVDAEVAPVADKEGLEAAVTPAAVDSTAASGEPIAEAVMALQEVMEPAPVPEPALEGGSSNPVPPACRLIVDTEPAQLHEACFSTNALIEKCCAVMSVAGRDMPLSLYFGRVQLLTE